MYPGCTYIETSAKNVINVEKAFFNLVRQIRVYNKAGSTEKPLASSTLQGMPAMNEKESSKCCGLCSVM